jgi:hypothetical protein
MAFEVIIVVALALALLSSAVLLMGLRSFRQHKGKFCPDTEQSVGDLSTNVGKAQDTRPSSIAGKAPVPRAASAPRAVSKLPAARKENKSIAVASRAALTSRLAAAPADGQPTLKTQLAALPMLPNLLHKHEALALCVIC